MTDVAAATTPSQPVAAAAARGFGWYVEGWRLFVLNPGMWIVCTFIALGVVLGLSAVPALGVAAALVTPALVAGLMQGARALELGADITIADLWRPLLDPGLRPRLLWLGGAWLLAQILAIACGVVALVAGGAAAVLTGGAFDPRALAGGVLSALLLFIAPIAIATTALLYACPLVLFRGMTVGSAMRASIHAVLRNAWPMTIAGLVYLVLALLAGAPLLIGLVLFGATTFSIAQIVLVPVSVCALYRSYCEIFPERPVPGQAVTTRSQ